MSIELNRPVTEEQHRQADEMYRECIKSQKVYMHMIADKLRVGGELNALERGITAAVVRGMANGMLDFQKVADKLDAGEELNASDGGFVAAILKLAANGMSEVRKRAKGQSKVPDDVVISVALDVVFRGKSQNASMLDWAGIYEVDISSIKKALKKLGYESIKKSMENSRDKKEGKAGIRWIPKAEA